MEFNTVKEIVNLKEAQVWAQSRAQINLQSPNWINSRYAIYKCLKLLNKNVRNKQDLEIENHLKLVKYPNIKVSLTHSKVWAAAICSENPNFLSVGIDIEKSSRRFPNGANKYLSHKNDNFSGLDIEKWCLKEAIFKAAAPLFKCKIYLTDIQLDDSKFLVLKENLAVEGKFELEYRIIENQELIVASSWVLKLNKI